jgi:acyl dehydratase
MDFNSDFSFLTFNNNMKIFQTLQDLAACVGQEVAVSDWLLVTQDRIDLFAKATEDHQWIHVDPEKSEQGPFGVTIAHGYLTLSLLPQFFDSSMKVIETRMGINYGLNKVRFTAPVLVNSRLRARLTLMACSDIDQGGVQMNWHALIECEGSDKPVCIAETVVRRYP